MTIPTDRLSSQVPATRACARGRVDVACVLVLGPDRGAARARADLRQVLAVRWAGRARRRAGLLHGDASRSRPDRRHARPGGRAPRVRERLPSSRLRDRPRQRLSRDAAVPLSRLDVRARRVASPRTAFGARGGLRPRRLLVASGFRRDLGAVRLRQSRPGRRTAGRDARRPPRHRRRLRCRLRRAAAALQPRLADRGQLEGGARELPRVLPLPRRSPGLQQGDRRRPRLVRAVGVPDVLESDRRDPGIGPQRQGEPSRTCPRVR